MNALQGAMDRSRGAWAVAWPESRGMACPPSMSPATSSVLFSLLQVSEEIVDVGAEMEGDWRAERPRSRPTRMASPSSVPSVRTGAEVDADGVSAVGSRPCRRMKAQRVEEE